MIFPTQNLSIQSKLILLVLVATTTAAVVVGVIAFNAGKDALTAKVLDHLNATRVTRGTEVTNYLRQYCSQVHTLTESDNIIKCMREFRDAFQDLQGRAITPQQQVELLDSYRLEHIPRLVKHIDGEPVPEQLLPTSVAGQYLQYYYLTQNPYPPEEKHQLLRADDASVYSSVHAANHAKLTGLVHHLGYYDFILVDADTTDIVYSYRKEIDFGAKLDEGLLSLTRLSQAIHRLRRDKNKRSCELVDFEAYRPSFGRPAAFVASPIFDGTDMIGILVLQMPTDEINDLLTNNQDWRAAGLGETGESLLVGDDYLLRSESRFQLQSPDQLRTELEATGMPQRELNKIESFGTLIMNKAIHTEAIENARLGRSGIGQMTDYRGKSVLISYGPLEVDDLDWNIVAKMDTTEAFEPIYRLGRHLLITITGIGLCACLATTVASHQLLRPLNRIMQGVEKVTEGSVEVEIPVCGKDEIAQLAIAFNKMTQTLSNSKDLLRQKVLQNEEFLVLSMPRPAIQRLKDGLGQSPDQFSSVSVLWVELQGLEALSSGRSDERGLAIYTELIGAMDDLAQSCGVEKLGSLSGRYLAVCGLSEERIDHVHRLAAYARELMQLLDRFNLQNSSLVTARLGLDSGSVYGALAGRTKFGYELWGPTLFRVQRLANSHENVVCLSPQAFAHLRDVEALQEAFVVIDEDVQDDSQQQSTAA